jgi:hypothetical protein
MSRPGEWARDPHATVAIEKTLRILDPDTASAVGCDLFILTIAAERGRVRQYHPNGEQVRICYVLPDPARTSRMCSWIAKVCPMSHTPPVGAALSSETDRDRIAVLKKIARQL